MAIGDRRKLTGFIEATGKDFETFGSDEFLRPTRRDIFEVFTVGDDERPIPCEPFRWGGECRIEVHLNYIANDNGTVQVHGFTSFFEGTSEDTPDERDREILNFLVPKGEHPTVVGAHMQSGDDLGDIRISLNNDIIEEE
ncbi:MAG: hypothetical protein R2848_00130 [Thermomicrobiales bacterium]